MQMSHWPTSKTTIVASRDLTRLWPLRQVQHWWEKHVLLAGLGQVTGICIVLPQSWQEPAVKGLKFLAAAQWVKNLRCLYWPLCLPTVLQREWTHQPISLPPQQQDLHHWCRIWSIPELVEQQGDSPRLTHPAVHRHCPCLPTTSPSATSSWNFAPPNTTSKLKPVSAGLNTRAKALYKKYMFYNILLEMNQDVPAFNAVKGI